MLPYFPNLIEILKVQLYNVVVFSIHIILAVK